jgi:uncharacterized protein YlaI
MNRGILFLLVIMIIAVNTISKTDLTNKTLKKVEYKSKIDEKKFGMVLLSVIKTSNGYLATTLYDSLNNYKVITYVSKDCKKWAATDTIQRENFVLFELIDKSIIKLQSLNNVVTLYGGINKNNLVKTPLIEFKGK